MSARDDRKAAVIVCRLPQLLALRMQMLAYDNGTSTSEEVRRALEAWVDANWKDGSSGA